MKHFYTTVKKFIFLFSFVIWFSTEGFTQVAEREPNNTFETADTIGKGSVKTGSVNNVSDPYDYFKAVFPTDGTLKIYVTANNNGGGNGYLYMRGYDRRKGSGQVFEKYISDNANVPPGGSISDVITIYGRAADTFYFRFETPGVFSYSFSYDIVDVSENDNEPNGTLEEALGINQLEEKKGHISYVQNGVADQYDYYKTNLPKDGTLKIYVKGTNNGGGNGYLYFRGFDRRKGNGQVFEKYISNDANIPAGKTIFDTITVYGRAADSFYFRFESSTAFSYSLKYDIIDTSENDAEPNDAFENAISMASTDEKKGHISYVKNGVADPYDYYRTVVPVDGTLKIYVEGTNNSGANSYLYFRGFDKRKGNGQVFETYISGNANIPPGTTITDSVIVYGVLADTFYFRFEAAGAFKYKLRYVVVQNSDLDAEPNNTFEQAVAINQGIPKVGQVGYTSGGVRDDYDYYKTMLPADGTLKIYVKGTNNGGGNGYLYFRGFDRRKGNGQVFEKYISDNANVSAGKTIFDTITVYGRAADSFYFRFEASTAFSYSLKYDIVDTSENDTEPNGTFEEALSISQQEEKKGHISYVQNGVADQLDYYKANLQKDGKLKIYVKGTNNGGGNGYLYFRGFDRQRGNGQVFEKYIANDANIPAGKTIFDTITVYGRAADSFYFRFEASTAFSYSIKYDIIDTSENDIEPNGTFEEALSINQKEEKKGHISYVKNGIGDQLDYYKTNLPKDGTLKIYVKGTNNGGGNGYIYFRGFDRRKGNGQVFEKYIANDANIPAGKTIFDTITVNCRAADSFYFRFEASTAFSYSLQYDMVDTSANDAEPNNTFETSVATTLGTIYKGHIGYVNNGGQDSYDYYKTVLPGKGTVKIIVEATNSSGGNGWLYLRGYDKRKGNGQIFEKYISNNANIPLGVTIRDTIALNCLATDTFYLRWESSGCFRYTFKVESISRQPKANMEYERLGNTVGFRPQLTNADKFIWTFGDGTTSTAKYPMKTYAPGFWVAKLIVTNTVCNFKDTAQQTFEIKGVEYYTPKVGGAGGDAIMQIFGGGLDTSTVVKLVKGGVTISPVEKYTNTIKNQLTAVLDLHFAAAGTYDVVIQVPGQPAITYPNGFIINNFIYPYTWSEVHGPSRFRTNLNTRFTLVVGNKGNVTASGVVIAVVWPKDVTINWENKFITPPVTGRDTVILPGDPQIYSLDRSDIKFIYDSLQTSTPIDSFAGKPYKGFIRYILIPHIPAGSTIELPFIAKTANVQANRFITWTQKPNQWGSCHTGNYLDQSEDLTAELIDGADLIVDKTKIPLLKAFTKTAKIGQKHAGSAASYLGKQFWGWYDGYEVDQNAAMADWLKETEANNAFAIQTATDELGTFMLNKGIGKLNDTYQKQVDFVNKVVSKTGSASVKSAETYLNILNRLSGDNKRLNTLKNLFDNTKNLGTLSDKLLKIQKSVADCPELQKQLEDLLKQADKELHQRDVKEKPSKSVTSLDPNEIVGPEGYGTNQYVNKFDRQYFRISFENVDTATAAAQIVVVKDTLDKNKFDLSTFEFGSVSVGTKNFRVPKGRKEFVFEQQLTSAMNVRINGELDTLKGIITWQFTAIDPLTKDLPAFEGFLPPNKTKPEGEGSVSYTVFPLSTTTDGTVFLNRASIIFDQNLPILTNTWQNIADIPPPVSSVSATVAAGDSIIHLQFTGSDAKSGVGYYNLYVSENGGPWQAFSGTPDDTLSLNGQSGKTYSFYSVSQDKVGNMESKTAGAETTVTLGGCTSATPTITASGVTTFCQGDSLTLSSSSTLGNQWYKNGASISGATNQTYIAKLTGNYTVTATVNNCTSSPSSPINVVVGTPAAPTDTTNSATGVSVTAATLNGTLNANCKATTVTFDYGTSPTLDGAINVTATTGGTVSSGYAAAAVTLSGLAPGTVYYFRIKATNSSGTTNGSILSFTTVTTASNNADLSNLSISAGTLTPAFAAGTTTYTASVDNNVTSVDVTSIVSNANAVIKINGITVISGTPKNVLLNVGTNTLTIVVTAQDGTTTKTYTITITRSAGPGTLITDYFRTKQSGNWNDVTTWESSSDNVNWINATLTPDFNANIISVRSGHTVTITANVMVDQTIINSGGSVIVNPNVVLRINDGAGTDVTISTGGNILLRSTATGTAMIGNSSGTVLGDVTVERFISAAFARSAWRLLTAPLRSTSGANVSIFNTWQNAGVNTTGKGTRVTGPAYNATNGLDANTFGASMKWFDGSAFQNVSTTNNPAITPLFTTAASAANNGYLTFIDGDRNATSGSPNTTTLSVTGNLQIGDQTFATNAAPNGFTLIGNPYASPVDLDLFRQNNTSSNIKTTYYYSDPYLTGTYGYGGYVTVSYDGTGSSYTITPAGVDHTRILQSGQAMFVQTASPATGTPSVTFKETQKSTTNVNIFRTPSGNIESLGINLNVIASGSPVLVDGIIAKFDNIYSASVDNYDAAKFYNIGESIAFIRDNKALSIERRPLIKSEDVLNLNLANLKTNRSYQFEINPDFNAPIFNAWLKDNYLQTMIPINVNAVTTINFTINSDAASTGASRFSIVFSKPAVVQAGNPSISVFPNPITNGIIKIQFNNMPQGVYNVRLLNNLGQTVLIKQINHSAGSSTETIQLNNGVKGTYHLEVIKPDKSKFSTKVIAH